MSELDILDSRIEGETPVTVLNLKGHLHGDTEGLLMEKVRQLHREGSRYLLLDLSGVEVLTSAGLRAIHNIFNLFTPRGDIALINAHGNEPYKSPYFKMVCPNPNIYYVLNIAGFLQNIPIFNAVDEALTSFSS
ncbi:MAG: STAS domain-containing protein [Syntrophothermus sp.]